MSDFPKLPLDFALTTERLLIRRLRESDAGDYYAAVLAAQPRLAEFLPWATVTPYTFEHAHKHIAEGLVLYHAGREFRFGGFDKNTGELLLAIDFRWKGPPHIYNFGYLTFGNHTGQGYMQEAIAALTDAIFEQLPVHRLTLECEPRNPASASIARKNGFVFEGLQKQAYQSAQGNIVDLELYAHTPESWKVFKHAR